MAATLLFGVSLIGRKERDVDEVALSWRISIK